MTMLKKMPEEVLDLWNNWEIRGMVLLSLLLQTILIVFGSQRKTNARNWIRILVWSAYLSADMVATAALGTLARSQGDSSGDSLEKANNSIQAFWAPFLLLHLGGPDTITAYSIEDNELWLRHLLDLVFQVGVALYVFSRSWGSGILSFIAIPMLVVGIAKYAERTWVLWSSCSKSLKNFSLLDFLDSCEHLNHLIESETPPEDIESETPPEDIESETPPEDLQRDYLLQAYVFSDISKFVMQDLVSNITSLLISRELISKNKADGAFKVVEAELGLIYDMLYTKAPLIYSRGGIILRCISSLLSVTAFITFQVKIDKHDYTTTDIIITYLLFAAAVFLEFYAFLCLVSSDWTMIWLIRKGWNSLYSQLRKFSLTGSKRWSRSISQYNLISSSKESEQPPKCLELLGIDEMMRQMHVNRKDLTGELLDLIFKHLRKKAEKIKEDFHMEDKNARSKIIGQRGDGVLEREGLLQSYKWCTTEVEFSRSILVWHLATEACYLVDKDGSNVSTKYETSRCLSEYMMYLLLIRPNMLSKGFGDDKGYQATLQELRGLKNSGIEAYEDTLRDLWGQKDRGPNDEEEYQRTLQKLRNSESYSSDDESFEMNWKLEKSVLRGVYRLARQLHLLGPEKRWEMINEVWVEMLAYAAAHCPWKEHTHQLRRGGEFLTHISLLMLHLGLSAQYDIDELDLMNFSELPRETQEKYFGARDMFKARENYFGARDMMDEEEEEEEHVEGIAAMYGSSRDEELKKLEKIVANTKRELQGQHRELQGQHRELQGQHRGLEGQKRELEGQLRALEGQQRGLERQQRGLERQQRGLERQQRGLERQQRRLEQWRSSLIVSTPQQGFDSLPRSLPAQTDDGGTGQPPSNNEISLSME